MSHATIVTDLSYGDAGKGTTVDYLARMSTSCVVIRHNGGPQAAHNVMTPEGRHHTFSQFGSASFVPGVKTHLSRFMLVNPLTMETEAQDLINQGVVDIWQRLSVDREALIITPWQQATNRLRELARGDGRHGSCAQGVGETMADSLASPELVIRVKDITAVDFVQKLQQLRAYKLKQMKQEVGLFPAGLCDYVYLADTTTAEQLAEVYRAWFQRIKVVDGDYLTQLADTFEHLIFEGAQGVLLDEWFGFHPFTTWSTTTPENALILLKEIDYQFPVKRLGILRAYTTRHGPGPFVTEDNALTTAIPDYHNGAGEWQGAFRVGHLDLVAHAYAIAASGGVDELMVTGLDRRQLWRYCTQYKPLEAAQSYYITNPEGALVSIKIGKKDDLAYQAGLTESLLMCTPDYQSLNEVDGSELVRLIESILRVPVGLTSFGPLWTDKQVHAAC